jgi:transcription elongation factor Elf1
MTYFVFACEHCGCASIYESHKKYLTQITCKICGHSRKLFTTRKGKKVALYAGEDFEQAFLKRRLWGEKRKWEQEGKP